MGNHRVVLVDVGDDLTVDLPIVPPNGDETVGGWRIQNDSTGIPAVGWNLGTRFDEEKITGFHWRTSIMFQFPQPILPLTIHLIQVPLGGEMMIPVVPL